MSERSRKNNPKLELELKLNLSLPKTHDGDSKDDHDQQEEENRMADVSSPSSCDSSCLPSTAEDHQVVGHDDVDRDSSGGAPAQVTLATLSSPMVVLGCPRCLMYVMLSEVEPRCPRCKSTELLDLFGEDLNTKNKTT